MELAELDVVLEDLKKQNVMQFSFQKLNLGDIEKFGVIMQLKSFRKPTRSFLDSLVIILVDFGFI